MNANNSRLSLPELENYIRNIDAAGYARTRNYLGGSTKLSEYISRGFISLPRVQSLLLEKNTASNAFKLLSELSWREYWHHTWRIKGDGIFDYFRPLSYEPRAGIPTSVLDAKTGIDALDNGIRQLYNQGFIDNHMRMWIAGLVCNIAKCDWRVGAQWMHSYLVDGDLASNHLSWQWVAGAYTGSVYLPQQANINTYTKTNQLDTYLDKPYSQIGEMGIPPELEELSSLLPKNNFKINAKIVAASEIDTSNTILLYSPWTLDPTWRNEFDGFRLLIIPATMFAPDEYSQNVMDSILYFAQQIDGLNIAYLTDDEINNLNGDNILRKEYPGIRHWPGKVDQAELLHPNVDNKFYRSYSAYWKAIKEQ